MTFFRMLILGEAERCLLGAGIPVLPVAALVTEEGLLEEGLLEEGLLEEGLLEEGLFGMMV
jgi:hypothetical protein